MVTNDATILRLKHDVLYEVAKLAWEGELEEKREEIPYQMIPGPAGSVPVLYLQGERDHPSESAPGRGNVSYQR